MEPEKRQRIILALLPSIGVFINLLSNIFLNDPKTPHIVGGIGVTHVIPFPRRIAHATVRPARSETYRKHGGHFVHRERRRQRDQDPLYWKVGQRAYAKDRR